MPMNNQLIDHHSVVFVFCRVITSNIAAAN